MSAVYALDEPGRARGGCLPPDAPPPPSPPETSSGPRPVPDAARAVLRAPTRRFQPLVVEDDAAHALLLRHAFEEAGLPITLPVLGDGEAAIEYLKGEGPYGDRARFPVPTLLLLDLLLPKMSGCDVARWVRAHARPPHVPILILTSLWSEEGMRRAYEAGANSYLVKPASFRELITMARAIGSYWSVMNHRERG